MARSISGTGDLGEWFEIHNPTTSYWDISTCSFDDNNATNLISTLTRPSTGANSTIIPPGAYRVFAQSAVSAENHGLTPDFVYDQLIAAVRDHLPAVHRYYALRKRILRLPEIHHYDCYVPLVPELERKHTWDEAVDVIVTALRPLGSEYGTRMERGLRGRWCDRYPNAGKR